MSDELESARIRFVLAESKRKILERELRELADKLNKLQAEAREAEKLWRQKREESYNHSQYELDAAKADYLKKTLE